MPNTLYKLRLTRFDAVNIFAARGTVEDIQRCLITIFTTHKYTVPLFRDFGLDMDALDQPTPRGMALLRNAMYEVVEKYEPRAELVSVAFEQVDRNGDDRVIPVITWRLKEGATL